jgi:hypothetical protein
MKTIKNIYSHIRLSTGRHAFQHVFVFQTELFPGLIQIFLINDKQKNCTGNFAVGSSGRRCREKLHLPYLKSLFIRRIILINVPFLHIYYTLVAVLWHVRAWQTTQNTFSLIWSLGFLSSYYLSLLRSKSGACVIHITSKHKDWTVTSAFRNCWVTV